MNDYDTTHFLNMVQGILQAMEQMAGTLRGIESTLDRMADLAAASMEDGAQEVTR